VVEVEVEETVLAELLVPLVVAVVADAVTLAAEATVVASVAEAIVEVVPEAVEAEETSVGAEEEEETFVEGIAEEALIAAAEEVVEVEEAEVEVVGSVRLSGMAQLLPLCEQSQATKLLLVRTSLLSVSSYFLPLAQ